MAAAWPIPDEGEEAGAGGEGDADCTAAAWSSGGSNEPEAALEDEMGRGPVAGPADPTEAPLPKSRGAHRGLESGSL
jgi:hypothetical protein